MKPSYFLTAYEIAVKHGFKGTEEEWLGSLTAFYLAQQAGYKGSIEDWLNLLNDPVPNMTIGTVTTLEGGSEATASISGDKRNPVLNLGIPRGLGMTDALPLNGGTMKGSINMAEHPLTGLPDPVNEQDAVPKKYVDLKAEVYVYYGTFLAGDWSGQGPYTQTIAVDGVLASDKLPLVDIDLRSTADVLTMVEAWGLVHRCMVAEDHRVTAYCYQDVPKVDIPVFIKVVR